MSVYRTVRASPTSAVLGLRSSRPAGKARIDNLHEKYVESLVLVQGTTPDTR
jgi:hypothetical protein